MTLTLRKYTLLFSSILIFPLMLFVFNITTETFGPKNGYLVGFLIYWLYCLSLVFILSSTNQLSKLINFKIRSRKMFMYSSITFIPITGALYINFIPYVHLLTLKMSLLVLVTSLINGVTEELYWRGLYLSEFKEKAIIGLWLSTFLFGVWHIALYSIAEISYGGFLPLVFGSAFMGLLWAFCSRKLNSIAYSMIAHVLVNIFAFTGLYIENGFLL